MAHIHFADGPCAGQTTYWNGLPEAGQIFPCGGHFYEYRIDGEFHDIGAEDPRTIGTGSLGKGAPKGWHDLQLSVNHRLPTALNHARRVRVATRRMIGRRHRLG